MESLLLIPAFLFSFFGISPSQSYVPPVETKEVIIEAPSEYTALAQCITEKGWVMYGTKTCPHCKAQLEPFGNAAKYIDFVDCNVDPGRCMAEDIQAYPTWKRSSQKYEGRISFEELSQLTFCPLD